MTAHYDLYDYQSYWRGRVYEHEAECLAITDFFARIHRSNGLLDVGGGFGRLAKFCSRFTNKITLLDPSQRNLSEAKTFLRRERGITLKQGIAESLPFKDSSFSTVLCVRVLHHIPDPGKCISELSRVTRPGGYLILEFANKLNFKSLLKHALSPTTSYPDLTPLERRSPENIAKDTIPFVNHHPKRIKRLVLENNFHIISIRSVSNFRHPIIKRVLPIRFLLFLESTIQNISSKVGLCWGPSIFILAQKADA